MLGPADASMPAARCMGDQLTQRCEPCCTSLSAYPHVRRLASHASHGSKYTL